MEDQLNIAVLQEKRPVTYKFLARTQGIHVNAAKQALSDYAKSTPNVHAIYCIAGRLLTDNNTDTIRLVKDLDLEEVKKQFRQVIGIHVYSVIPYDPMDLSVLATANQDIPYLSAQDRYQCGVLKNSMAQPEQAKRSSPAQSTPPPPTKPSVPAAKPSAPPPPAKPSAPPTSSNSSTAAPKKGTLSFNNHKTKSTAKPIQKQPTPEPKKPAFQASDIFSDNEDMDEPSPVREPEPEPMEEDFMELDEEPTPVQEQSKSPPAEVIAGSPRKRALESDTPTTKEYTDKDGFWVSETVEPHKQTPAPRATSAPKAMPAPRAAPKSTPSKPAASKKEKAKTNQKQSFLTGYFSKKA